MSSFAKIQLDLFISTMIRIETGEGYTQLKNKVQSDPEYKIYIKHKTEKELKKNQKQGLLKACIREGGKLLIKGNVLGDGSLFKA